MNTQEYIEYLIQQQLNNNQRRPFDTLNGYKNTLNNINALGGNFKTTGDYLSGLNNNFANKLGSGLTKAGNTLQGGVSAVKNIPQNVFKGFAQPTNPAIESALSSTLGNTVSGIGSNAGLGTIGNAVADTAGSSLAGVGSNLGTTGVAGEGIAASSMAGGAGAGGAAALGGAAMPLIGLGLMAIDGANRKRAKQSSENLMNYTNQMANAVANDTTAQDFANNIIKQSQNNLNQGVITGGASPIEEPDNVYQGSIMDVQPQVNSSALGSVMTPNINNAIATNDIYNSPVDNNVQTGGIEKTKQGLLSKFMSGLGDFAQGYQESRNTGFKPENFDQNRFAETKTVQQTNPELEKYQAELGQNQDFNKWLINANKDKDVVLNDIANGHNSGYAPIAEWINDNPNSYEPITKEKTTYTGKEKGKMARFGEGVGTIVRALQNPTFQGLVAGGLGTALTGNPLYGLGLGYKFANQRAMSDAYRDVLKQNGINIPEMGTFGNVTSQDMKTIGDLNLSRARLEEAKNYHDTWLNDKNARLELDRLKAEWDREHKKRQDEIARQNATSKRISAQASQTRANNSGKGANGGGNQTNKTDPKNNVNTTNSLIDNAINADKNKKEDKNKKKGGWAF